MQVVYRGTNQKLLDASGFVNDLADNADFWAEIAARPRFDFSRSTGAQVAQAMRGKQTAIVLREYRPPWPRHRHTNAYTDPAYPDTLFYNSKKLWRSVPSMINTIVHEFVHLADFAATDADFGHGDQGSEGKENSAPWWIGALAERYYLAEVSAAPQIERITIDPAAIVGDE